MKHLGLIFLILSGWTVTGQSPYFAKENFTRSDTLQGSLRAERSSYDVHYYHLDIRVDPRDSTIEGHVDMHFHLEYPVKRLQIDLYQNMKIDEILLNDKQCVYQREGNAIFVLTPELKDTTRSHTLSVYYGGRPVIARMPPWDGGFVWSYSKSGQPWVGVACQGEGASLWWPNKDHLSDEPDSMMISVEVPKPLICVSNGSLISIENGLDDYNRKYNWKVHYPINNYNVTVNIAEYAHFQDTYTNPSGRELPLDYYVLPSNLGKAKNHFEQVDSVLEAYEYYFGPFPFWKDGFALVESPYVGMEHQTAIAYGNKYLSGYLGSRLHKGLHFDYIIVHETGHEYFGNSISCSDMADIWIHESFTTYMESLYVEYWHGKEKAIEYLNTQRPHITSRYPIVGPYNVNWNNWDSGSVYFKGAWMLHTLRNVFDNDEKWFAYLRALYKRFAMQVTDTGEILAFTQEYLRGELPGFFEQYLFHPEIPVLELEMGQSAGQYSMKYRWSATIPSFQMPVKILINDKEVTLRPAAYWQTMPIGASLPLVRVPLEKYLIETNVTE